MTSAVSKAEYLKRYLENDKAKRKKKPKPSNSVIPRVKIVDRNIDLKSIPFGEKEDFWRKDDDEAPLVAEIIDERPEEVKILEMYESSRWKKLDSTTEDPEEITQEPKDTKESLSETNRHSGKTSRHSDSDCSSPRKTAPSRCRHDSDSDSFPSQSRQQPEQNKRRHESDSDISPPRRQHSGDRGRQRNSDRPNKSHGSAYKTKKNIKIKEECATDSDLSPERPRRRNQSPSKKKVSNKRTETNSDSDLSPLRENRAYSDAKASRLGDQKRPDKTLSGLKAGLQNSATMREETHALRERERKQIRQLDAELSGRDAQTIVRDRKTGKKRNLDEENREKEEKEKRLSEQQQKYMAWGKGIEQTANQKSRFSEDVYEMSKPLARYCDDEDLEEQLKNIIHDDDPMSAYMKKKRQSNAVSLMPEYTGPPPPPNRFNIKPGYRWDGVDRSNGFEKRFFEKKNCSKAKEEEAYLWSVQEM